MFPLNWLVIHANIDQSYGSMQLQIEGNFLVICSLSPPTLPHQYVISLFCHFNFLKSSKQTIQNPTSIYCIWPPVDRATFTYVRNILFLQTICDYIEEDVLCVISMRPANEWMDMNTRSRDTAVSLRGHCSNDVVRLVYSLYWWGGFEQLTCYKVQSLDYREESNRQHMK